MPSTVWLFQDFIKWRSVLANGLEQSPQFVVPVTGTKIAVIQDDLPNRLSVFCKKHSQAVERRCKRTTRECTTYVFYSSEIREFYVFTGDAAGRAASRKKATASILKTF